MIHHLCFCLRCVVAVANASLPSSRSCVAVAKQLHTMVGASIKRRTTICGGSLKAKGGGWHVKDLTVVNNIEFIKLSHKDTGFTRFISDRTKIPERVWLQHLRRLRNKAMVGASAPSATESLFGEVTLSRWHKVKLREKYDVAVDDIIEVELPAVVGQASGVVKAAAMQVKMLGVTSFKKDAQVELSAVVLNYVWQACNHCDAQNPEAKKRRRPDVVGGKYKCRWMASRGGFVATRSPDDATKIFRVGDDGDKFRAKEKAIRWADGDSDVESGDESASSSGTPTSSDEKSDEAAVAAAHVAHNVDEAAVATDNGNVGGA